MGVKNQTHPDQTHQRTDPEFSRDRLPQNDQQQQGDPERGRTQEKIGIHQWHIDNSDIEEQVSE
jgi:hypothetical protein